MGNLLPTSVIQPPESGIVLCLLSPLVFLLVGSVVLHLPGRVGGVWFLYALFLWWLYFTLCLNAGCALRKGLDCHRMASSS